jgi:oligoribonuclease NrnB/cAMP/cGMP phosphodiesterase (DHH superfamily)
VARVLTVLAHGDADWVSSAAVVKAALAGEYEVARVYFTHPVDLAKDLEAFVGGMSTSSTWLSTRRPPRRCGRRSGATGVVCI